jgi:multidrug efflux pump subunit AcrB
MKNKLFRAAASALLTLLLVVTLLPVQAHAAGATLTGTAAPQAGDTVTLTLSVPNKVYGLTADLSYSGNLSFTNYNCSVSGWSIVVNNNIILIDTYNLLRRQGLPAAQAALETGCLRLRPVLLTAVTTILGLVPMVLGVNVDLLSPSLGFGAPSTQWWTQLSSAIAGGLAFATLLTLLLTPCLLVLGARFERRPANSAVPDED